MPTKLTLDVVIKRANSIHHNKYDYSRSIYKNNKTKIEIICPIHGSFWQAPNNHINQEQGCMKCGGKTQHTKEDVIEAGNKIHHNKYDYSKIVYINSHTKIEIICSIHGSFWQKSNDHIGKEYGCPKCGREQSAKARSLSINDFIVKAKSIHGNAYDYSRSEYKNFQTKIEIICNECKEPFWQRPTDHIYDKNGCPSCNDTKLSLEEILVKAAGVHGNKYDYSKINYTNVYTKIEIICKKCNQSFWQTPAHHIYDKTGCPNCLGESISKAETQWLNDKNIPILDRNVYLLIGDKKYNVDGYNPTTNTIYEFYGDYWHGNPDKFRSQEINPSNKEAFGELYKHTMGRETELKCAGYNIISIWESDWREQQKKKI